MELRQIHYFIAIAEKGAISAASAYIHIAQPALSAQLASLEGELGVALCTRHRRGVTLTEAGEIFLEHAYKVTEALAAARSAVQSVASQPRGEVTFGLPVTTSTLMTVPIVELVRARYPDIKLNIVDGMSGDVFGWLVDGRLDVAILYGADRPPQIKAKPIVSDALYLMGHENELTRGRETIAFCELAGFHLLHNSPSRSRLRQLMDETARKLGCPLQYAGEIDSVPQLKLLVYRGRGFTVLPKISLGDDPPVAKLRLLRIVEPDLRLTSYLALSPKRDPSRAALCVFELVDELAQSLLRRRKWAGGRRAPEVEAVPSSVRETRATTSAGGARASGTAKRASHPPGSRR
ncbi:MAG: LysR family transcriptional regulator [Burkholderiales bacterium]|nr:LysR family transcriptional regulator [Burkholderiales bacterium]